MTFEKRSRPAVALLTRPFIPTARALAELQGMPGYPFVVLPHPITSLSTDEVTRLAATAAPYVEALLVRGAARPENGIVGIAGSPAATAKTGATPGERIEALVAQLTEELAGPLRADGADLAAELVSPSHLVLTLEFGSETCKECVMPAPHLLEIYRRRASELLGPGFELSLQDPRAVAS